MQETQSYTTIETAYVRPLSTQELAFAVLSAKRAYAEASYRLEQSWLGEAEAVDECDREALADYKRITDQAMLDAEDKRQAMEAAYAAYWGKVN